MNTTPFWKSSEFWISIAGLAVLVILSLTAAISLTGEQVVNVILMLLGARTVRNVGGQFADVLNQRSTNGSVTTNQNVSEEKLQSEV